LTKEHSNTIKENFRRVFMVKEVVIKILKNFLLQTSLLKMGSYNQGGVVNSAFGVEKNLPLWAND
jgi:hypothetical protein